MYKGELQLGGFDPAAADGDVMWVPMVNLTGMHSCLLLREGGGERERSRERSRESVCVF